MDALHKYNLSHTTLTNCETGKLRGGFGVAGRESAEPQENYTARFSGLANGFRGAFLRTSLECSLEHLHRSTLSQRIKLGCLTNLPCGVN